MALFAGRQGVRSLKKGIALVMPSIQIAINLGGMNLRKAPRGTENPLRALVGHLLKTPFHRSLQNVRWMI
jgi:hypothetical protein